MILLSDPQSSTAALTLVEHAVVEVLREDGHEVARLVHRSGRQARAQRLLSQATSLRQAARSQFDQLVLDDARKKYTKALTKLERAAAMTDDLRPLKDTLSMLGATYLLLGQERRARGALRRLLILDPAASADDAVFNPQMMAAFEGVASRVRSSPSFAIEVKVDPPGAAVIFDGKLVGVAPVTVSAVHQGRHYVTASLKGHETVGRAFHVKARGARSLSLRLNPARSDSRLDASSSVAISAIDDPELAPEAAELAASVGADSVLLLAATASTLELVRYSAHGGNRRAHSVPKEVDSVESARELATALLSSVTRGGGDLVAASGTVGPEYDDDLGPAEPRDGHGRRQDGPTERDKDVEVASLDEPEAVAPEQAAGGGLLSSHSGKNSALWITYGSALALAGVGGVFGYLALDAQRQYEATDQLAGVPFKETGERNALLADVMYGAAIATLVTGLCIHIFWEAGGEPETRVEADDQRLAWTLGPNFLRVQF